MSFRLRTALCAALIPAVLSGCEDERSHPVEPIEAESEIGRAFDAQATGTIRGEVVWQGPVPLVPPFEYRPKPQSPPAECQSFPNPNAPVVDGTSRGVANAVVFLRLSALGRSLSQQTVEPRRGIP
jgi:hypothetical protein